MNKLSVLFLSSLLVAAAAAAQTSDTRGVTESTDPARAAAVERHAQALQTHQAHHAKARGAAHHAGMQATRHAHRTHHHRHHTAHKKVAPKG